jgi:hypothetical protein
VFPILYISVPALENEAKWRDDPVLSTIALRQYVDWRALRHLDVQTTAVREQIERLCSKIVEALNEPWVAPEERRRMEEARARQQAEDEIRRLEAEAKRRAHEEERQRQAEAEARQRADEERSRREAEAKLRGEQKEAFAGAKHADSVGAIDAFLANYPESRHMTEARTLRAALVARDEACNKAMASDDPAVPQTAFGRHRKLMAAVLLLVLLAGAGLAGVWLYPSPMDRFCAGARKLADYKLTDFTLVTDTYISRTNEGRFQSFEIPSSSLASISALPVVGRHPGAKRSSLFGCAICMGTSSPISPLSM